MTADRQEHTAARSGAGRQHPAAVPAARDQLRHPLRFVARVLKDFRRNQGLLLSGACAYYTLLSIVPLFTLLLIVLSRFMDREQLLGTIAAEAKLFMPGYSDALVAQLAVFLENRELIGVVGIAILLFFSSMAFTALENAMSVIFYHRVRVCRRHFLTSAIIPYLFIMLLGIGMLLITLMSGALQAVELESVSLLGTTVTLHGLPGAVLYALGVIGLALLLTAFYLVMPVGRLSPRHALIGGFVAAVLWEITRHILVWYFSTLSFVNVIYGSLATAVVVLLSLEVASIILLLGAQVIAEFERRRDDAAVLPQGTGLGT
ncbi:MAG: YihY/virulence factor BrkB family protein [Gammaproteobacteria bacterium]|jgi:YihY family inner membrane protein